MVGSHDTSCRIAPLVLYFNYSDGRDVKPDCLENITSDDGHNY